MAEFTPVYLLRIFDSDGVTPLTPIAGAVHSDPFQVASKQGVAGYAPLLSPPRGRRGAFDPVSRRVDTGKLTLLVLDQLVGTAGNSDRWVTAFAGDENGLVRLHGKRAEVDLSTDGSTFPRFFTGKVQAARTVDRTYIELTVTDLSIELDDEVFVGDPALAATNAQRAPLMPVGLVEPYLDVPTSSPLEATTSSETVPDYGTYIKLTVVEPSTEAENANVVTREFHDIVTAAVANSESGLAFTDALRVRLKITSGARVNEEGDFYLVRNRKASVGPFTVTQRFVEYDTPLLGVQRLASIGISEVDAQDPAYLALPPAGETVEFRILAGDKRPTKDSPIVVDYPNPATFVRDVLDGYFGSLNADGTPKKTYGYKESSLAAIEALPLPGFAATIDDSEKIHKILTDWVCKAYNLGYRVDEEGDVVLFNVARPASVAGVPTLTNADLDSATRAPSWSSELESAITRIEYEYTFERVIPLDRYTKWFVDGQAERRPNLPPWRIDPYPVPFTKLDISNPDLGDLPYKVEAKGIRFTDAPETTEGDLANAEKVLRDIDELTEEIRAIFHGGVMVTELPGLRSSADVSSCQPGDLRILDVDELPDPATNKRGGPRLCLCTSRTEDGPRVVLGFMDMGATTVATAPTLGTLSLTPGAGATSVRLPVTLNAAGDEVGVWTAVTDTTIGTAPAESSSRWKFARLARASGDVDLGGHPSGARVWARARSHPIAKPKIPSGYVFPTAPGYVDTVAIAAPTGLAVQAIGNRAIATWTVGDPDLHLEVFLGTGTDTGSRIARLVPGSARYVVRGLQNSIQLTLSVRHVDLNFGAGPFASVTFTTDATPDVSPPLKGVTVLVGRTAGEGIL